MQLQSASLSARGDMGTAGSIMFLLGIGELLEEWTHKKSVGDLAQNDVLKCRKRMAETEDGQELLVSCDRGDRPDDAGCRTYG